MKIYEIIGGLIAKTKIFEMAFGRADIEAKITSISDPIVEHLVKVLKWEDAVNYNKHLGDINNWMFQIQRLKIKGNKKPSQHDYYTWMFEDVAQDELTISRFIKGLHRYHQLPVIRSDDEVYCVIKNVLYQISFELPLNKFNDINDYI
jgi:hypothetical protein